MTNEEIFNIWCPAESRWAPWAKPVLFAQMPPAEPGPTLREEWQRQSVSWVQGTPAVVIDLPGVQSILAAIALAQVGYQPVPLFNCCTAPDHEVLPTAPLQDYLVRGAADLPRVSPNAPPAFMLDSDRITGKAIPSPRKFDNRWLTFPQDFPSASSLKEAGITGVILLQTGHGQPLHDLAHVLIRWQEGGLPVFILDASSGSRSPVPVVVTPPPRLRWFFLRTLALFGFMRNSAGGFGSVVPEPGGGAG